MNTLAYKRMELYSALAEALKYPSMELLNSHENHFLLNALGEFSEVISVSKILRNETKELAQWLNDLPKVTAEGDEPVHRFLGKLEVEYNRLFYGPFAPLVYPYESVYLDVDGLVMGQSAVAVLQQYREVGLAVSPEFKDLPDHIVVELEFMAYLCAKEAESCVFKQSDKALEYLRKESDFIKKHLNAWVLNFCDKIIAESKSVFYPSLAKILSAYLCWDKEHLTTTLETIEAKSTGLTIADSRSTIDRLPRTSQPIINHQSSIPEQVELAPCISCGKPYLAKNVLAEILEKLDARNDSPLECGERRMGANGGEAPPRGPRLADGFSDAATESLRYVTMCCPQCKRIS